MNKTSTLFITLYLILFSFLHAQTNTTPCTATRLCESKTLDNSYPTKDTQYLARGSCSSVTFTKAVFYRVIIKTGSTFTFMIRPNNSSDYDWALWKNIGCNTITSSYDPTVEAKRFSANNGVGVGIWNTGMDISKPATLICDPAAAYSDGIVSALDVAPGDELLLGINQAQDKYKSNYQLVFGGVLGGGGNATFICVEEYPNPYYICDVNNDGKEINYDLSSLKAHLITSYLGGNTSYGLTFYETEKEVVKEGNPIVKLDITSPKREVFCHITKPNGDLHTVLAINLELSKSPEGKNKEVIVCGDKEDLTKFNTLLSTTPNTKTLYYKNISDAQNESDPLSMPTSVIDGQRFYAVIKTIERGCSIIRELTIKQPVILPVVENLTLCSGSPGSLIVSNPSAEVSWYTTAIGGTAFHSGSSYPFPGEVNSSTTPIVHTYYVENKSGECISNRTKVTITINSTLPSPTVSDLNLCSGIPGFLVVINPSATVNWYTTATGGTAIHTGNTFPFAGELNTGTAPIVHTYYVENKSGDCLSERTKVTITINSTLPSPTVSDLNLCSGETGVLTVNNPSATVNWYTVTTGGTAFYTGSSYTFPGEVNTGIAPIIHTYYVENNSGDCISARVAVTVTVNSSLPKPLIQNLELCSGAGDNLVVSNPSSEVNWYATATGGTAFHSGSSYPFPGEVNSSTTPIVHTYYVENKSGDCVSDRTEVTVTVMSITPSPKVNPIMICSGDKVTLTAIDPKGKVSWYDSNEDLVGSEITFSPTKNLITTTTYTVYQKAENSCISLPMAVTVTVSSITASPIIKSETICSGEEVTLIVANAIANADITWYDDKGTEVGRGIAFTPTENLTKTTTYTVYQKEENSCISLPSNVTVTVKEKTPDPIIEPKTICFGEKVTLTVTNAPDKAEITWYNDKGEKVGSGNSFSPEPNLTETTIYYVEQRRLLTILFSGVDPSVPELELEPCVSDRTKVTVTVNPSPSIPLINNLILCSGAGDNLVVSNPSAEVNWYTTAIGGTAFHSGSSYPFPGEVNSSTTPIVHTYYVENKSGECISNRTKVTITINSTLPSPTVSDLNLCSGETGVLTVNNPSATVNWYTVSTGGTAFYTGSSYTFPGEVNTGIAPIIHTYYVENNSGDCISARVAVTVTVNSSLPKPLIQNLELCSGAGDNLVVSNPSSEVNWYATATGGTAFHSGSSYPFPGEVNSSTTPIVHTYYVENKSGDCVSDRTEVTVTVMSITPSPKVNPIMICSGDKVTLTAIDPKGKVSWYDSNEDLVGSEITFSPTKNLITTTTYTVYQKAENSCISLPMAVTVTVSSITASPIIKSETICSGEEVTLIVANAIANADITWYDDKGTEVGIGIAFTPTENLTKTTTYTVYQKEENSCISLPSNVTVTVKEKTPNPIVETVQPIIICSGESATLTIKKETNPEGKYTIRWYSSLAGGIEDLLLESEELQYITPIQINKGSENKIITYYVEQEVEILNSTFSVDPGVPNPKPEYCVSTRIPVTVTVKPEVPNPELEIEDIEVCSGESVILRVMNPKEPNTVKWYLTHTGGTVLYTGPEYDLSIQTNTGTESKTTTYYVDQEWNGCTSEERVPVTVTVKPEVSILEVKLDKTGAICSREEVILTANATGEVSWYDNAELNGAVIHTENIYKPNLSNDTESAITYYYYVVQKIDGCFSKPVKVEITVKPTVPNINEVEGNNTTICSGESVSLLAKNVTGEILWYDNSELTAPEVYIGNPYKPNLSNTTGVDKIYTYYIVQKIDGCFSKSEEVTITVKSVVPSPIVKTPNPICLGSSVKLQVDNPVPEETNIRWYTVGVGGVSIHTGLEYSPSPIVTTAYYVEQEKEGCISPRIPVQVTVKSQTPDPIIETVQPIIICSGESATLTIKKETNPEGKYTIRWYSSLAGGIEDLLLESEELQYITPIQINKGSENKIITYYVEQEVEILNSTFSVDPGVPNPKPEYCVSTRIPVTVTVKPEVPQPEVSVVSPAICSGERPSFTVSNAVGEIRLYDRNGLEVAVESVGDTYTFVNPLINEGDIQVSYTYYAEQIWNGCNSSNTGRTEVIVKVNPEVPNPEIAVASKPICSGERPSFTVSNAVGEIRLYDKNGLEVAVESVGDTYTFVNPLINEGDIQVSYTYYAEQIWNGCNSSNTGRTDVIVKVNPEVPNPEIAVASKPICSGERPSFTVSNAVGEIRLYDKNGLEVAVESVGDTYTFVNPLINEGDIQVSYTYYAEQIWNGCNSSNTGRTEVIVKVNPEVPNPEIAVASKPICSGERPSFTVSNAVGEIRLYDKNGLEVAVESVGDTYTFVNPLINEGDIQVSYTYYAEQIWNGCNSSNTGRTDVIVKVNPEVPNPEIAVASKPICSGERPSFTVSNAVGEIRLYDKNGLEVAVESVGDTYTFVNPLINEGDIQVSYTYYAEQIWNGCNSSNIGRIEITVTVNPQIPNPIVKVNLESLCSNSEVTLTVTNPKGKVHWYDSEGVYLYEGSSYVVRNITTTTTYYVEQEEDNICKSERIAIEIIVPVPDKPKVNREIICVGDWAELEAINPIGVVSWYDSIVGGNLLGSGNTFTTPVLENDTDTPISYFYYAEQKYCHTTSDRTRVEVIVLPKPKIGEIIKNKNSIEVLPKYGSVSDYLYSIDGGIIWQNSNVFRNLEEGRTYSVEIKNKDKGCLGDSKDVKLLRIPNFISPNGDGVNDTWKLDDLGEVESVYLKIFNRYGKILYETTDPKQLIWDGKYLGRPLPSASYWYILQWTPKSSKIKEEMGGWIALKNSNHE